MRGKAQGPDAQGYGKPVERLPKPTTVDEARAALIKGVYGYQQPSAWLMDGLDALIAAVRAESAPNVDEATGMTPNEMRRRWPANVAFIEAEERELSFSEGYGDGLRDGIGRGRAESAETLRALREAARVVVDNAEADDDFDGQFMQYLVDFDKVDALRAALAATPAEDES